MSTEAEDNPISRFVSRISVHFPPPKFESEKAETDWLKSIRDSLRFYSSDILDRACQRIIDTRGLRDGERWFPLPAAIRKVCDAIIVEDNRRSLVPAEQQGQQAGGYVAQRQLAFDLLRTPQGKEAAADGWIYGLFRFVVEHGRAPTNQVRYTYRTKERAPGGGIYVEAVRATEVEWLRRSAKAAQEAHEMAIRGGWEFAKACAALGDSLAAKREKLRAHAMEEIDLRENGRWREI